MSSVGVVPLQSQTPSNPRHPIAETNPQSRDKDDHTEQRNDARSPEHARADALDAKVGEDSDDGEGSAEDEENGEAVFAAGGAEELCGFGTRGAGVEEREGDKEERGVEAHGEPEERGERGCGACVRVCSDDAAGCRSRSRSTRG